MTILAIESSAKLAGVALMRDGAVVAEREFPARMTLNRRLADEVLGVLAGDARAAGLSAIAVGIGPGSFTGVRMGVALAKALAHALELPLVGVSAPEAIVAGLGAPAGAAVCVLQPARAEEVYVTALEVGEGSVPVERGPTQALTFARALRTAEQQLGRAPDTVCGGAAIAAAQRIGTVFPDARVAGEEHELPRAAQVGRVGAMRIGDAAPTAALTLTPRYGRLSQAEREFGLDLGLRG